jgi:hypothetical protein
VEDVDRNEGLSGGVIHTMRSRVQAVTLTAALLGAVALGVPAGATAAAHDPVQYVTPRPIVRYDRTFRVEPNTTRTYRMSLEAMAQKTAALVPCWGYDLTGPGIDVAAASLHLFGWVGELGDRPLDSHVEQRADGWYLPEAEATVGPHQLDAGASCRKIGWNMFVGTDSGVASAAEVHRAKRQNRLVRIQHPRRRVKVRPANRVDDGSVQVPLAGVRMIPHERRMEIVVQLVAGPLAGPTTITLHGRVLITR